MFHNLNSDTHINRREKKRISQNQFSVKINVGRFILSVKVDNQKLINTVMSFIPIVEKHKCGL